MQEQDSKVLKVNIALKRWPRIPALIDIECALASNYKDPWPPEFPVFELAN